MIVTVRLNGKVGDSDSETYSEILIVILHAEVGVRTVKYTREYDSDCEMYRDI